MRFRRVAIEQIVAGAGQSLVGAVLLAPIQLGDQRIGKGSCIQQALAGTLAEAARAGTLREPLRLAWPDPGDLHEDDAALRLAKAIAGPGLAIGTPSQSRIDLMAEADGVLRVQVEALGALNRIEPLEVFTLFHGQAVRAGQVVASAKVAPHLVAGTSVEAGEAVARRYGFLVKIDPYLPLRVAAIAIESLSPAAFGRFDEAARTKVTSLGGRFEGTTQVAEEEPDVAAGRLTELLEILANRQGLPLILVGGVSAGDPLSPFYHALDAVGGRVLRRGVPAHPGSMIWLAALGETTLLGLPQCGMFSMVTAADLVLPRLLTGERVTPETLADLGHGGLLGREMRFRFPDYARDLDPPS